MCLKQLPVKVFKIDKGVSDTFQQRLRFLLVVILVSVFGITHYRVVKQYAQKFYSGDFISVIGGEYTYYDEPQNSLFPHGSIPTELVVIGLIEELGLDTLSINGDCAPLFYKYKNYQLLENILGGQCVILKSDSIPPLPDTLQFRQVSFLKKDKATRVELVRLENSLYIFVR